MTIVVNKKELVTLVCSPVYHEELALGYLFSEGFIRGVQDIAIIKMNYGKVELELKGDIKGHSRVPGGWRRAVDADLNRLGFQKVTNKMQVRPEEIHEMVKIMGHRSELFKDTGGVHNALLNNTENNITIFREDIGRHNAIDKIIGYMVWNELPLHNNVLVISSRISADILLKIARIQIPILVSCSGPTDMAIDLAKRLGITLIGFVRGERMNIYSHKERVKLAINS